MFANILQYEIKKLLMQITEASELQPCEETQ